MDDFVAANSTGTYEDNGDDVMNATYFNDTVTSPLCVLCKYRLEPWLKAVRVSFGSFIVLANLIIFVCLQRARTLSTSLRLFLSNVSIVDGLYGFGFLYHSAIVDFPAFILMNLECKLRYGFLCMVSMVAMFTLMAMCVERVIALQFPFSYPHLVTKTTLGILLVFLWLIPLSSVLPAYVLIESDVGECNFVRFIAARSFLVFSVTYFVFMIVTVICQMILYFTAKRQIKKILPTLVGDLREHAAFKMTVKATSTTLSMAVPFVICSTPKIVTYMYLAFNPNQRIRVESLTTLAITVYLNVSHSLVNPFIYISRLPQVRTQFFSLFLWKDNSSVSSRDEKRKDLGGTCSGSKQGKQISSSTESKCYKEINWTESRFDQLPPSLPTEVYMPATTSATFPQLVEKKDAGNLSTSKQHCVGGNLGYQEESQEGGVKEKPDLHQINSTKIAIDREEEEREDCDNNDDDDDAASLVTLPQLEEEKRVGILSTSKHHRFEEVLRYQDEIQEGAVKEEPDLHQDDSRKTVMEIEEEREDCDNKDDDDDDYDDDDDDDDDDDAATSVNLPQLEEEKHVGILSTSKQHSVGEVLGYQEEILEGSVKEEPDLHQDGSRKASKEAQENREDDNDDDDDEEEEEEIEEEEAEEEEDNDTYSVTLPQLEEENDAGILSTSKQHSVREVLGYQEEILEGVAKEKTDLQQDDSRKTAMDAEENIEDGGDDDDDEDDDDGYNIDSDENFDDADEEGMADNDVDTDNVEGDDDINTENEEYIKKSKNTE